MGRIDTDPNKNILPGRGGPLKVFLGIPDIAEESSLFAIDVFLSKDDFGTPGTCLEESCLNAVSIMVKAAIVSPAWDLLQAYGHHQSGNQVEDSDIPSAFHG